jgi:ubiquinone/menaquinone biosynthesis C-methylase UbiE
MGLYRGGEIGELPLQVLPGSGKHFSERYEHPVLLGERPRGYEDVRAFDQLSSIHDQLQAPFSGPVFEDVTKILVSLGSASGRILDCSCGGGTEAAALAAFVPNGEVVGCDLAEDMVLTAASRAQRLGIRNMAFFQADVAKLPDCFSEQFDFVYCSFSFHHYNVPLVALQEMRRALVPGGYAFVVDAGPSWMKALGSPIAKWADPGWVSFYTGEECRILFLEAGFSSFYWVEILPGIGLSIGTR